MTSTHWTAFASPDEWPDNPVADPVEAAKQFLHALDSGEDAAYEISKQGETIIVVRGYIQTTELIKDINADEIFDGYEAGSEWFKPTGEMLRVLLEITGTIL